MLIKQGTTIRRCKSWFDA